MSKEMFPSPESPLPCTSRRL